MGCLRNCNIFVILATAISFTQCEQVTKEIQTQSGKIRGIENKNEETGDSIFEFRGIPYAKPPTGSLRFKKSEPFGNWENTFDATSFGAACPQNVPEFMPELARPKTSEDCLFLNVYVPKTVDKSQNLSVMVSIHGGGFEVGFGNEDDLTRMAMEGEVIMVSFNYRLGVLGFFALDHAAARGNYALWDQKLALQWVHNNIETFGGNPKSVTIFGESAGGYSVSLQSLIPSNKGLFQRVIAQSGVHSKTLMRTPSAIKDFASYMSDKTSCILGDEYKFVDCLRQTPIEELVSLSDFYSYVPPEKLATEVFFMSQNYPVVDGELFKEDPIKSLDSFTSSDVTEFFGSLDFIIGTTSNEGSLLYMIMFPEMQAHYGFNATEGIPYKAMCEAIVAPYVKSFMGGKPEIKQKICDFYKAGPDESVKDQSIKATHLLSDIMFNFPSAKMLEYHFLLQKSKTYHYQFSKTSPDPFGGPPPPWFEGAGHGDDLLWLFKTDQYELSEYEKNFSKMMIQYWTNFAKRGTPYGGDDAMPWIPFDLRGRMYLDLDVPITLRSFYKTEMVEFWKTLYPDIDVNAATLSFKDHDEL